MDPLFVLAVRGLQVLSYNVLVILLVVLFFFVLVVVLLFFVLVVVLLFLLLPLLFFCVLFFFVLLFCILLIFLFLLLLLLDDRHRFRARCCLTAADQTVPASSRLTGADHDLRVLGVHADNSQRPDNRRPEKAATSAPPTVQRL